jgi:enoyl-CoA hydratase/carnithine racemase
MALAAGITTMAAAVGVLGAGITTMATAALVMTTATAAGVKRTHSWRFGTAHGCAQPRNRKRKIVIRVPADHFGLVGDVVPSVRPVVRQSPRDSGSRRGNKPLAVRNAKASVINSGRIDEEDAPRIERRFVTEAVRSPDTRERLAAFAATREPHLADS